MELSADEAELQARLDDLYRANGAVTEVENNLKTLLARNPADELWKDEIVPADTGAVGLPTVIEILLRAGLCALRVSAVSGRYSGAFREFSD